MNPESQTALFWIVYVLVILVCTGIAWLLLYSAIRMGVSHGMRGHTRWVDSGKDYEPIPRYEAKQ